MDLAVLAGVVVAAGAFVAALPRLWRFIRGAARVPVILEGVAMEFSPNGGGSLKDAINRLASSQDELRTSVDRLHNDFQTHRMDDKQFEQYVHTRFHDVINEQTKQWLLMTMDPTQVERLVTELKRRRQDAPLVHGEADEAG